MPKRLFVMDGADKGQAYALPDTGKIVIGNSRKRTDFCIHDLLAAPVHCQLDIAGDRVTVAELAPAHAVLVNGVKVSQQELQLGDVIRAGNSYLRLETMTAEMTATAAVMETKEAASAEKGEPPLLPPERLAELSGYTIGHYRLGGPLTHGQCGMAFRARDLKTDDDVVLKILAPDFPGNPEEMQGFIRAMKQRHAAEHPSLIALHGAGRSGHYTWIATELIEGESLTATLERLCHVRKVPWKPAFRLALNFAHLLEFLHENHIIHANITPANVILPTGDESARLNDLGVWLALEGSTLHRRIWKRKYKAELAYLSPEHLNPETPVDDLSDQYCLGAVVYAYLTGRPPFEGSPEEVANMVRTAMPVRPKDLRIAVPDDFQAALVRMLSKHPEDRYGSPRLLRQDLEEIAEKHDC